MNKLILSSGVALLAGVVAFGFKLRGNHVDELLRQQQAQEQYLADIEFQCRLKIPRSPANQLVCIKETMNESEGTGKDTGLQVGRATRGI